MLTVFQLQQSMLKSDINMMHNFFKCTSNFTIQHVGCVDEYLVLYMERCLAVVIWCRQLPDILCYVDIFYFSISATANELHERIVHKTVLVLHAQRDQHCNSNMQQTCTLHTGSIANHTEIEHRTKPHNLTQWKDYLHETE